MSNLRETVKKYKQIHHFCLTGENWLKFSFHIKMKVLERRVRTYLHILDTSPLH